MDEMQSDSPNKVDGEKVKKKKKKKRSKTTEQHELTESPQEQSEKRREKKEKRRNSKTESDDNLQTHTGKKKRRKLDNEGETSVMDDGVSNQHEAQTQELQGSSEEKTSRRLRTRVSATQTSYVEMAEEEQTNTEIESEHEEEEPNTRDEESDPPDVMIGTRTRKTRKIPVDLKLLEELKEFCPNMPIDSRRDSDKNKMFRYDLPRFREFKKQGIAMKQGRFSEAENERLRQNVSNILALTKVKDAARLFYPKLFPREEGKLAKVKRKFGFYRKIAEGIARPCQVVYSRGQKMFDHRHYKGSFTEEEDRKLLKYYKRYGPKWQKIAEKIGRSPFSLRKRYPQISSDKRKGPWTTEEVQRLLKAVREHVVSVLKSANPNKKKPKRVSREILYENLPWTTIAENVETRCYRQCREKWMCILSVRMSSGTKFRGKTCVLAKIRLIKAMYEMQVEDLTDLDWGSLTAAFGNVPPTYVQKMWYKMKNSLVPDWNTRSFKDNMSFLHNDILPCLVRSCKGFDVDEVKVEQKELFRLSKIFKDIEEDVKDIKKEGQDIEEDVKDIKKEGQDIEKDVKDIDEDVKDIEKEGQDIEKDGRDGDEETGQQENNSFNQ
ncbi:transcription termination factor 1-like [Danio aesculapii]|uniref:transcription termination factor 1-like n=1 Tax=Danio aesculapii TaxID=1142201 RepID=UPI0024C0D7BF|nr:transcription termination factor 1-like [Danio aesculapii]XP_056314651.1 transcription termination factor 1-like [Danio aesculapii]XP_056314652.1 transcription termination factor 1-like [Danio aesculapii]